MWRGAISSYCVSSLFRIWKNGSSTSYEAYMSAKEVLNALHPLPVSSRLFVTSHSVSLQCVSSQGQPSIRCDWISPPRHSKYSPLRLRQQGRLLFNRAIFFPRQCFTGAACRQWRRLFALGDGTRFRSLQPSECNQQQFGERIICKYVYFNSHSAKLFLLLTSFKLLLK